MSHSSQSIARSLDSQPPITVVGADGYSERKVSIRPLKPNDKQQLQTFFYTLSPETVSSRFLGPKWKLSEKELSDLTDCDFVNHVALVATVGQDQDEIVAVGRFIVVADRSTPHPKRAEVAITVSDQYQRQGLGRRLMLDLISIARELGIAEFEGTTSAENARMILLLHHHTEVISSRIRNGVLHFVCDLEYKGQPS